MAACAAVAAPAYIEMGHFRQFSFDGFDQALDAFVAITQNDPVFPIAHDVQESVIVVDEANGETVLKLLTAAGIRAPFTQMWCPVDEVWIFPADDLVASDELEPAY
jgi:hypothetical protein